jgi:hypothetical protein
MHWLPIIWLVTWPVLIYVSYRIIWATLKKYDPIFKEEQISSEIMK